MKHVCILNARMKFQNVLRQFGPHSICLDLWLASGKRSQTNAYSGTGEGELLRRLNSGRETLESYLKDDIDQRTHPVFSVLRTKKGNSHFYFAGFQETLAQIQAITTYSTDL